MNETQNESQKQREDWLREIGAVGRDLGLEQHEGSSWRGASPLGAGEMVLFPSGVARITRSDGTDILGWSDLQMIVSARREAFKARVALLKLGAQSEFTEAVFYVENPPAVSWAKSGAGALGVLPQELWIAERVKELARGISEMAAARVGKTACGGQEVSRELLQEWQSELTGHIFTLDQLGSVLDQEEEAVSRMVQLLGLRPSVREFAWGMEKLLREGATNNFETWGRSRLLGFGVEISRELQQSQWDSNTSRRGRILEAALALAFLWEKGRPQDAQAALEESQDESFARRSDAIGVEEIARMYDLKKQPDGSYFGANFLVGASEWGKAFKLYDDSSAYDSLLNRVYTDDEIQEFVIRALRGGSQRENHRRDA